MTIAKIVANMGLRMPYVFLSTIAKGVHSSVGHLGAMLGIAELLGLLTAVIGRSLDRGEYRKWTAAGSGSCAVGVLVMGLATTPVMFAVGFAIVAAGVAWFTTTAHAFLGSTVAYELRGRAIGTYEFSWALSVLLGAPLFGLISSSFHWNTPFLFLTVLCALTAAFVTSRMPANSASLIPIEDRPTKIRPARPKLPRRIILTMASSLCLTFAAISVFSIYGSWLKDRFGLSDRFVGALSIAVGGAEFIASTAATTRMDRWGKRRSVAGGIALMIVGIAALILSPKVTAFAVAALFVTFLGFEFGFVALLTVISEVGEEQRGTVLALDHALSPLSRAGAAALATGLYDAHGLRIPGLIGLAFACTSLLAAQLSRSE
jgi:MFS transporter, DHA1 family, inner membrane transport protein